MVLGHLVSWMGTFSAGRLHPTCIRRSANRRGGLRRRRPPRLTGEAVVPGLAGKGHAAPLRYAPTAHDRGAPDASEGGRAARLRRGRLLGGGGLPDRGA